MNPLKTAQKREKSPVLVPKGHEGKYSIHHVAGLMSQARPAKVKPVQNCTPERKTQ